jgi:multiple sugar transport system substrate-binding protein
MRRGRFSDPSKETIMTNGTLINARGWRQLALRLGTCGLIAATSWLAPITASAQTTIKFIAWNFQVETVQEFVKQFEAENPAIKVDLEIIPSAQFAAKIQLMKNANAPFDALYVFDHVLGSWSSWLEPLDGYDGAADLKAKMLPVARQSMTYNGKLYGLPYFTSYFGVVYNKKLMTAAGIAAPPKTYAEWTEQARKIKAAGLANYPMVWPVKHTGWGGMWVMNTMVASRGGKLLDAKLNVTPEGLASLKWWEATYREGLSDPNGIELDPNESARAFMNGNYYTLLTASFFAGGQWANDKEKSKVAGAAFLAPTPEKHTTVGFARMYGINAASTHKKEAWQLIKFLGGTAKSGDYVTPKQWVEKGALTWGYEGVEKDAAVSASLKSWGADPSDMAANLKNALAMNEVVPFQAPWYAEWELYANGVLQSVLAGRVKPEEGATQWSEKAKQLAARYQK